MQVLDPFYRYRTEVRIKFFKDEIRCFMFMLSEAYLRKAPYSTKCDSNKEI